MTSPEIITTETVAEKPEGAIIVATNDGDSARARWRISGAAVNTNTAHFEPDVRDSLRRFFEWAVDPRNDKDPGACGELLGVDRTVITRVYAGTYINDNTGKHIVPTKMIQGIRKLLAGEDARRDEGKIPFIRTPTVENIWTAANLCLSRGRIGMVWGKSQIGKTTALREYQRKQPHGAVKYICAEPSSGTHELVRQLARACGLGAHGAHDAMKARILSCLDKNTLLIVDEIHQFAFTYRTRSKLSCLETLRWLHDQTGCGLLLCGTNVWRDDLTKGKDKEYLEQLARRGAVKLQLPDEPTANDLNAIYKAFGLVKPAGKAAETMRYLAKTHGLTVLTETLAFGQRQARKAGRTTTEWDDVIEAHDILADMESGEACK